MEQLVDSMSSITFDQATVDTGDCVTANSQSAPAAELFDPAAEQHCHPCLASNGHHDLRGHEETHQIMALSQTPMTLASTLGVGFSQQLTFQPSPADSSYVETAAGLAPNRVDSMEQYGCLGLQDMLDSDEFFRH